ncbi:helix-turn-helix transcriptional regulator [Streptomyces sp. H10-C2]|uniref:helix-turn-helix transcriptional regulator n=1 Tax=unclassified Streptomyces TaxID=2593676 RepID=UPI0024BA43C5|nr:MULTISPECIES: helix-turn-helix transcriptional regulator [unclassified Streptomyces]MDJ0345219.1 helix-turn-helix transcriptional regulator [Streptomyces sp. PH10-H1]MDJ0368835.1 helix-turn-helix transcriptional regulator [Streptomyces sp. H10-C2]
MPDDHQPDWLTARRIAIGESIRTARRHKRMSQDALATAVGLDRRSIQRVERAETDPRLTWLLRIAMSLDIPLSDLVREHELSDRPRNGDVTAGPQQGP